MNKPSEAGNRQLILILGGARSGKSSYAEQLALRMARGVPPIYLATATPSDEEMQRRIANHRHVRGDHWQTIEAPTDPAGALFGSGEINTPGVVLLDCLTLLVSNLLLDDVATMEADDAKETLPSTAMLAAEERIEQAITDLLAVYKNGARSLVIVSNEVGMGIVPAYPLGRVYRDALGRVNARVAAEADRVLLLLAGLAVELKSLAAAWQSSATDALGLDE